MSSSKVRFLFVGALLLCVTSMMQAQTYIRHIYLDKREVFDSVTKKDWFFAAPTINNLHTNTKDYIINDELLFSEGDVLNMLRVEETARNLRRLGTFTHVAIDIDSVQEDSVDVYVTTQERWSTGAALLFGSGGGISNYGAMVEEANLAGSASQLTLQALYRTENDTRWQGIASFYQRRFLRTDFSLGASLLANRFRTNQTLLIEKPLHTLQSPNTMFVQFNNNFGDDFFYNQTSTELLPFHIRRAQAMYAFASGEKDRYFFSLFASVEDVKRRAPSFNQAYDNSGRLFFSLGSLRQEFVTSTGVNSFIEEDVPVGAWAQVVFGKTFAIKNQGESSYYMGGTIEQSAYVGNRTLYLYAQLQAGNSFIRTAPRYTYIGTQGLAHLHLAKGVVLANRFRQQTAWNWQAYRQLVLDNDAGLRGYDANVLTGENRIINNIELRIHPDLNVWFFKLGAVVFHDVGAVWNQSDSLLSTRFHNSVGLGLRIFNTKALGNAATFRIDFAYNFDQGKLGGIVFTTSQLFNAFGKPAFKAPQIFGLDIDNE